MSGSTGIEVESNDSNPVKDVTNRETNNEHRTHDAIERKRREASKARGSHRDDSFGGCRVSRQHERGADNPRTPLYSSSSTTG